MLSDLFKCVVPINLNSVNDEYERQLRCDPAKIVSMLPCCSCHAIHVVVVSYATL